MLAGAAFVTSASTAAADPTIDAYLAQLRALGINFPPDREEAVIAVAHRICYDKKWGYAPDAIAQDVHNVLASKGPFTRRCHVDGGPCGIDLSPRLDEC